MKTSAKPIAIGLLTICSIFFGTALSAVMDSSAVGVGRWITLLASAVAILICLAILLRGPAKLGP